MSSYDGMGKQCVVAILGATTPAQGSTDRDARARRARIARRRIASGRAGDRSSSIGATRARASARATSTRARGKLGISTR